MAGKHTFVNALEQNAKNLPGALAVVQGSRYLTFQDLNAQANRIAHGLLDLNIQRGDSIALCLPNSIPFIEVTYGIWKVAGVSVPLNYRFKDEELINVLNNSDSVGAIVEEEFIDSFLRIRSRLPKLKFIIQVGSNDIKNDSILQYDHWLSSQSKNKPGLSWPEQSDDDIGYNIYTGGTTGMPKGISYNEKTMIRTTLEGFSGSVPTILRQISKAKDSTLKPVPGGRFLKSKIGRRLISANATASILTWILLHMPTAYRSGPAKKMAGKLRILIVSPMMHSLGWVLTFTLSKFGATIFLLEGKSFQPEEALKVIEQNQIAILGAIGDATLKPVLAELDRQAYDLSSLQGIFASGMPTSAEVKQRLLQEYMPNCRFMDFIGSSELTGMAFRFYTKHDNEFSKSSFPVNDRIMILDPMEGKPVTPGEVGELARRTDNLPNGYYKDPEKTKKLIRYYHGQSWLMSGDLAKLDNDGTFHFVGRGSECINTGGEKVYPEEVESILHKIPGVKMAGITATPDEKWGEVVTAVIQIHEGHELNEQQVIDYTLDKISGYKRPRRVIFVQQFPITLIGKPHYRALRELASQTTSTQEETA